MKTYLDTFLTQLNPLLIMNPTIQKIQKEGLKRIPNFNGKTILVGYHFVD